MFDMDNMSDSIRKDYNLVLEYAREASTCVDPFIIHKRFRPHVPHKTLDGARHWARDKWHAMDSLPRSYRNMVNDDPRSPDDALEAAVMLWEDVVLRAEKAMDRIVAYEKTLTNLPSYLMVEPSDEMKVLTGFRDERVAVMNALEEQRKKEREVALQDRKRMEDSMRRNETVGGWSHRVTMRDGTSLKDIQVINVKGLPPHLAREVIAKTKPIEFKATNYYNTPTRKVIDPGKQADKFDNTPPQKIQVNDFKRGRNY